MDTPWPRDPLRKEDELVTAGGSDRDFQRAFMHGFMTSRQVQAGLRACLLNWQQPDGLRSLVVQLQANVETSDDALYIRDVKAVDSNVDDPQLLRCIANAWENQVLSQMGVPADRRWRLAFSLNVPYPG